MEASLIPLTEKQKSELEGYVAWSTLLFRQIVFLLSVVAIFWIFRYIYSLLEDKVPMFAKYQWWIVPPIIYMFYVYRVSKKWTGGKELRTKIEEDLEEGKSRIITVEAVECIGVIEQEDEGPAYIIKDSGGKTVIFAGQYLLEYTKRGFPWARIGILEAPDSKIFFGLKKLGEPVTVSFVRDSLTSQEIENIRGLYEHYEVLDTPFDRFKVRKRQGGS
ncbi:MAG: hypothetical protein ACYS76_16315 [Planctomycetota bacterium]|jgi:hypothetical protein